MVAAKKIDGSVTGLRIAEEVDGQIGVLPGTPTWLPMEPNTYGAFGPEITTLARDPIADDRQEKSGFIVDVEAACGFVSDLTNLNLADVMQGFMFADYRAKAEFGGGGEITSVSTGDYVAASGLDAFAVNDLVFASGFGTEANNGFKRVTAAAAAALTVTPALSDEASPPTVAKLVRVGVQGIAGDIDVDASGSLPALTSTTLDFTTLGLVPGEWIYLGGDSASLAFSNAVNNGFKRVLNITANRLEFDKSLTTMVTEASTTETVQLFFGRVLKNELGSLIKRRTYNLERTLGAPDLALPAQIQSEYVEGAVANTLQLQIGTADKVTADLGFMGLDGTTRDGATGVKSGNRPTLVEQDAFNTSSDFSLMRISPVPASGATATPLFGFLTEVQLSINNNARISKAVGVLGGFEITVGKFQVGGSVTAYFTDVAAIESIRANADVTLDMAMVKSNRGIVLDVPLVKLGSARLNVEQNTEITLPVNFNAASGAKVNPLLDHTLMWSYFDYLPTAAE